VGVAVISVPLGIAGVITRATGHGVMAAYVLGWALLFLRAMRREPHSGHGFVVFALLLYPLSVLAIVSGRLPSDLLGPSAVLPFSVLGATLLTTGLLRAQRRASLALAEREQAQALLRATNESLEQQVALRTAELRETIDGLESFNRRVPDLRGPLGGIVGITRLARDQLAAGDQDQAHRMLELIEGQAISSVKLIEALLALSRASDATLNLREVDFGQLVAEVVRALPQNEAPYCMVAPRLPTVNCDPELLRQVFANLIGNAIKFSNRSQRPQVEVATLARDGERFSWCATTAWASTGGRATVVQAVSAPARPQPRGLRRRAVDRQTHRRPPRRSRLGEGDRTRRELLLHTRHAAARAHVASRGRFRQQAAALIVLNRLHQLVARVHYERPVLHDRLAQRPPGDQQRAGWRIERAQHHAVAGRRVGEDRHALALDHAIDDPERTL
jgi:signal transduction histidine kinase